MRRRLEDSLYRPVERDCRTHLPNDRQIGAPNSSGRLPSSWIPPDFQRVLEWQLRTQRYLVLRYLQWVRMEGIFSFPATKYNIVIM